MPDLESATGIPAQTLLCIPRVQSDPYRKMKNIHVIGCKASEGGRGLEGKPAPHLARVTFDPAENQISSHRFVIECIQSIYLTIYFSRLYILPDLTKVDRL